MVRQQHIGWLILGQFFWLGLRRGFAVALHRVCIQKNELDELSHDGTIIGGFNVWILCMCVMLYLVKCLLMCFLFFLLDNIGAVNKRQSDRCWSCTWGTSVEDISEARSYSLEKEWRVQYSQWGKETNLCWWSSRFNRLPRCTAKQFSCRGNNVCLRSSLFLGKLCEYYAVLLCMC